VSREGNHKAYLGYPFNRSGFGPRFATAGLPVAAPSLADARVPAVALAALLGDAGWR